MLFRSEPGPYDIICGRNCDAQKWIGNRRFRVTIMIFLEQYLAAKTRDDKSLVIKSVIALLQDCGGVGARFIKKVGATYIPIEEKQIREKIGHAFRDMISLSQKATQKREATSLQAERA